tara:strand:+ start:1557 stop:2147 length:591 start_codon:yes stop_codon:yes gene_type:complete
MPRKASDKIVTHRIEFSPRERELVDSIINTQKENQRLDAITSTLNAAGVAIGGSGALIAGLGLAAWFGYSAVDVIKEKFENISDTVADTTAEIMTGQSVDEIVQDIMDATGYDVKDLNERGKQLIRLKRRFCNPSSQEYDEQKCAEVDALISQLNQEQQEAKAAMFKQIENLKEAEEDIYSVNLTGKLLYGLRKLL